MIKKPIGEMKSESIKKVVEYFDHIAQRGTARDIGVSGAFMSSLCARGYMKVIGVQEQFVCIDEGSALYRKIEINIYAPTKPIRVMLSDYCDNINLLAETEKIKANAMIERAKDRLTSAQCLLGRIDFVTPSN